ncbi:hypothetical protein EON76_06110 [bacterium]|nr:MAG: hypothetical protein EON76_06110 [bacterium]
MNKAFIVVIYCVLLAIVSVQLFSAPAAHAHVLLTDSKNRVGAILHVSPDDDPIAGQPSRIFFDIQSDLSGVSENTTRLTVTDETATTIVPVTVRGSYISTDYTFATQGAYQLKLTVPTRKSELLFTTTQRVSRGLSNNQPHPAQSWAKSVVISSLCAIFILGIVAFNRRKNIAAHIQ